jgi:hypothetical protein
LSSPSYSFPSSHPSQYLKINLGRNGWIPSEGSLL